MSIVDKIRALANQKGMSLPDLEVEIGLGNGTISRWRNSSPNTDKIQKVADYFNVSVDYLLGRDEKDTKILNNAYFKLMKNAEEKGIPPEDIEDAIMLLERARKRDEQSKRG